MAKIKEVENKKKRNVGN